VLAEPTGKRPCEEEWMGFEVLVAELTSCARAIHDAADAVQRAQPDEPAAQIDAALPGSRSGSAAGELSSAWRERLAGWNRSARQYAEDLAGAASDYQTHDGAAATGFDRQQRGLETV
jgi:hypothetical protein